MAKKIIKETVEEVVEVKRAFLAVPVTLPRWQLAVIGFGSFLLGTFF